MKVGILGETFPGECRVALIPASVPELGKGGMDVIVEAGAGLKAGFTDAEYRDKGATLLARDGVFAQSDIIAQVRSYGANLVEGERDLARLRPGQVVIGTADPLGEAGAVNDVAKTGAVAFALELVPRITRAQSMDVLSSMATIAGYKAVLLAANHLPRMFPMMMTAAGTIAPARVFVIGAGVAGLQAIASARKNGAKVTAFDVRPAVREQVESLGARFLEIELETGDAEDSGGYARAMSEETRKKQQELMAAAIAESDVVITTAAIPGRRSPMLIPADVARGMAPGSVIVDLAAERGGNCELTRLDEVVIDSGITILGPGNLPGTVPFHASQMFSRNLATFLLNMVEDGKLNLDLEDEIIADTLMTRDGEVVNARLRELLGLDVATTEGSDA